MKKRLMLAVSLLMIMMLVCSCAMMPESKLEALFRPSEGSVITSGDLSSVPEDTGDTVTISREEYEKYQRFSEVYSLFDALLRSGRI